METIETGAAEIILEREGAIAFLTVQRPEARNAMTFAMYRGLIRACELVDAESAIRVLVVQGGGDKAFIAGTDIAEFKGLTLAAQALDYEARFEEAVARLESVRVPTLALVRGAAVGGGVALALACDLRLASPDAKFGVPIARTVGNTLSIANLSRLVDLVGPARAKEVLFTASLWTADEALSLGLINEVVAADALEARVRALAEQIALNAPLTVQTTKEAVRRIVLQRRPPPGDDLVLRAYLSKDFREGVSAFLERRKPVWSGK